MKKFTLLFASLFVFCTALLAQSQPITAVSELSNGKVYTVSTFDRGAWYYSSEKGALTSTTKAGVQVNADDANQQFAFITVNGRTYIYSIGAAKFVVKSGAYTSVTETPSDYVSLQTTTNTSYPVVVAFNDEYHIGISNGYDPAVITNYNDLNDKGNQAAIVEVGEQDLSAVVTAIESHIEKMITDIKAFYEENQHYDEMQALGNALETLENATTEDAIDEATKALLETYTTFREFPFINDMIKNLEDGQYYIYYTDENEVKHYLQTRGANSVVTVTEAPEAYEIATGTTNDGKFNMAYAMKMNGLYISNTGHNATNIETKNNLQLWSSQVVFEKDGKSAIRLTNASDINEWHGNFVIGAGETAGTTIALDPTTALDEAMFIWEFEKIQVTELTYILTDELGNTYTGTYEGQAGTSMPTLSGVQGCTFENQSWEGTTLTADIVFPFPVSKEDGTTNKLMLSIFNSDKKWHAIGTDIKIQAESVATPTEQDINDWLWAIYPSFTDGAFTFTIKNIGTEQYVYTEVTGSTLGTQGAVTLTDEGTAFEAVTYEDGISFKVSGKNLYLSINSVKDTDVWLGVHTATHGGVKINYTEYVDNNPDTAIEHISTPDAAVIYDLLGRRVQNVEKGIYIVNGRKVVIK